MRKGTFSFEQIIVLIIVILVIVTMILIIQRIDVIKEFFMRLGR